MGAICSREYMVFCDVEQCDNFVDYDETHDCRYAKNAYKAWRSMGWKYRDREWYCPEHAVAQPEDGR